MNRVSRAFLRRCLAAALLVAVVACGGAPAAATPPPEPVPAAAPAPAPPEAEPPPPVLAFPEEPFRDKAPVPGPPKAAPTPKPLIWQRKDGIEVLLVERHGLPTVTLELTFDGGTVDDPPGQEGLGSVCAALLAEGTEKLDKLAFAQALADVGSSVGSQASVDQIGVSAASLTRHLDATLALWADTLRRPGMRQDEFDRLVKLRKAGLQAQKGTPASVAGRVAPGIVWGTQHAYGRIPTEVSYGALTLDACRGWLGKRLLPGGSKLYVVGDISRDDLDSKLTAHLGGDWQGKPKAPPAVAKAAPRKGKVFFVDMPGAEQAVLAVLHAGPPRKAADYHATMLMATILGGGFSSRVNMNLREKHGFAYGASAGFSYVRNGGTFGAHASVRNDAAGASLTEIFREMKGIRESDVTDVELSREKEGAILGLPARWSTGRSILGTFQGLRWFGLPLDEFDRFPARAQAVDAKSVKAAAQKWVLPDTAQVLVVGDGASVRPQIEALLQEGPLKGATIVTLDADGLEKP